ncbi:hypothetical protein K1T35_42580 [Pseudonocardia sp. DSM 110487]|uniref:hypothetical protein n=1 Tax=Pseudonocardia sp. DSM 110487 TaxID=2865833 RepID=UPI001C69DD38|nr:hypothetical protein [Pseudonocardia sp. DSM 110487]QYN34965.1 hypothetical protein K1T35_42580 [Pseudonocardia sp. DSM 110487]
MALDRNTATTDRAPEHEAADEPNVQESKEPSAAPSDSASPEPEPAVTESVTESVTEGSATPVAADPRIGGSSHEGDDNAAGTADGVGAGAAAVVSAGLALSSVTGTGVGDMLRARAEIVGQIEASVGGAAVDQVDAFYGSPWHTAALVNGAVALVAVVIGAVLLAAQSGKPTVRAWVRAVALGGVVLGGIGLLVAVGMYLDLFAAAPVLPQTPQLGG